MLICLFSRYSFIIPRGRPKKTWKEVVREDCQARKLNKEDAMDRCKWRKVIKGRPSVERRVSGAPVSRAPQLIRTN